MDTALLRTLVSVERLGSFAALAREEGVDPSSVSRRIAALEAELNLVLFERTTRRLALTEAGRIYLDRIAPLIDAIDEAADAAHDAVAEPSGLLRVTASIAFGERWLTPRLAAFRADYPRVEIELRLSDTPIDIVAEGIDVALRLGPQIEGSLVAAKLFDTRYRVVAAPSYLARKEAPRSPSDLSEHEGIFFALPRFGSVWRFRKSRDEPVEEIKPQRALTISNALAIRRAALDGQGVALLADWTVREDLENGNLIDLLPEHEGSATHFDTSAWIVYPSRSYVSARLRAFIEHLRKAR